MKLVSFGEASFLSFEIDSMTVTREQAFKESVGRHGKNHRPQGKERNWTIQQNQRCS